MKPSGTANEKVKFRTFTFALVDNAKKCLYNLPSKTINGWNEMKAPFGGAFPII